MYSIETYLTERTLGDILRAWAGDENVTAQPFVPGTRMRHDYEVRKNGIIYAVEFNGDSHYRDPNVIFRDLSKAEISKRMGKIVVEIPYFIQLNAETFLHFFNADFEVSTTYPHGFVATKMLPSSFCPIGYDRASQDLNSLPVGVTAAVMSSLEKKAAELGDRWVYYKNSVTLVEDGDTEPSEISWAEFVRRANRVHKDLYVYTHPL